VTSDTLDEGKDKQPSTQEVIAIEAYRFLLLSGHHCIEASG